MNDKILSAQALCKTIRSRKIVQSVSLCIAPGQIVGLLGPNGAGKTTLFSMLVGLLAVDSGQIFCAEEDITALRIDQRAKKGIAYLPQEPSIFKYMTVYDNIAAVLAHKGTPASEIATQTQNALENFHLWNVQNQYAISLSGGERRRLEIARTLALRPRIILLDEPFAGVDPISVGDIKLHLQRITQQGIAVLITDHNVRETLNICSYAYIMNQGKMLAEGTRDTILAHEQVRSVYLGQEFSL